MQGFDKQFDALSPQEKKRFRAAVAKMVEDLKAGRKIRDGLRIKAYKRWPGTLEMSWAPNGRALFKFGEPIKEGEHHVIWLAIGGHDIFG